MDTDAAFDRFIRQDDPMCQVEKKTRQECGFACRTQLSEPKARELFRKTYLKWYERQETGQMPDENIRALPRNPTTKPIDHMVQERIKSGAGKTKLEQRFNAIKRGK